LPAPAAVFGKAGAAARAGRATVALPARSPAVAAAAGAHPRAQRL